MDIIMPSERTRIHTRQQGILWGALMGTSLLYSFNALAELKITGKAEAEYIFQDVESEAEGQLSLDTLQVTPSINASLDTRTFRGFWSGSLTHLERDKVDNSRTDTFEEYTYSLVWQPFDSFLQIEGQGALSYQNTNANNYLVSDFLNNSDSLSKTRSNRISALANFDRGNWVHAQGGIAYADVASERSTLNSGQALDNNTIELFGGISNGDSIRRVFWQLDGTYINTDRAQNNNDEFITRTADGFIDIAVIKSFGIRLTAVHEANQVSDRDDTSSSTRKFNSYGMGLFYRQSEDRYIAVTANGSDSDLDEDDDETFIGLDFKWALSPRTNLSGSYGRRFYGEAASFDASYNSKYLRTSLSYSEDVTNTSRLLANPQNLGVFVCPAATISIADCFQPSSLTYQPDASEQLVQLTSQVIEFDDNIIIRKSTNFQAGYDFSRLTIALTSRYAEDDYLDLERLRRTYSLGTTLVYELGSYTNISTEVTYANITQRSDQADLNGETDNWRGNIAIQREIGRYLTAAIDFTYVDQSGDIATGVGLFGNNYSDRRISLSVIYKYQ
ncbi:TIGR03016 family PEP-CTERM system-associated outer membrane protein [Alteromonas sp. BL110]|nr:TIGR03016 family PEP-CTERM system-associated outer membrane protein [Alteromonas sp. BL110]RKM81880.1 TIGR03016 family PEP-CTERM system-associated outer membrane protein [Alteromonas sp. BL110]